MIAAVPLQNNSMTNPIQTQKYPQQFISIILPVSLLLLGIGFISLAPIFTRLSEQEIGVNATIFNRVWIATIFLGFCNQIAGFIRPYSSQEDGDHEDTVFNHLGLLILSGIIDLACILLWAWSLEKTSVTNSTLLHNLTPIFAVLGAWIFLKQSFNFKFIIGLILASIGSSIIAFSDFQFSRQYLMGDSLAFLSAACYGIAYIVYEKLRQNLSATTLLFYNCCVRTIVVFPLALWKDPQLFPSSWQGWLTVIGLGILCQGFGHLLLIYSLKKFSAASVSLFLLLDPILTAILAWLIFSEQLIFINWIAFVVVLVGIYYAHNENV